MFGYRMVFACAVLLFWLPGFSQSGPVEVFSANGPENRIYLIARNNGFLPYLIDIDYLELDNLLVQPESTFKEVVQPGKQSILVTLMPNNQGRPAWDFHYKFFPGDPEFCIPEENFPYRLPFQRGLACVVTQSFFGPFSHQNIYAFDFMMEEGTPICAAREGIVAEVKKDSDWGCPDPACVKHGNHVIIMHRDGTFAGYWHLKYQGATVQPGDRVSAGQVIGYSGNTGWSSGPHLHFEVFRPTMDGKKTINAFFVSQRASRTLLEQGKLYWH